MAHLLRDASASLLLIGPGAGSIGVHIISSLEEIGLSTVSLPWFSIDSSKHLSTQKYVDDGKYRSTESQEVLRNCPAQLAHTTGSTAMPKLISLKNICINQVPPIGGDGDSLIIVSPPQGYSTFIPIGCLASGRRCYVLMPPPQPPVDIVTIMCALRLVIREKNIVSRPIKFFTHPAMLERIARSPYSQDVIDLLRSFDRIITGGSPPSHPLVQWIDRAGLNLAMCNYMGSNEVGTYLHASPPSAGTVDWVWFQEDLRMSDWIRFEIIDRENGAAEIVILPGYPTLQVSNRPDGAFETHDLFLPHPTRKGRWLYWMRKDDVMVHSTGMKTDPTYSTSSYVTPISASPSFPCFLDSDRCHLMLG